MLALFTHTAGGGGNRSANLEAAGIEAQTAVTLALSDIGQILVNIGQIPSNTGQQLSLPLPLDCKDRTNPDKEEQTPDTDSP